jgi:hypothetical protein
MTARRNSRLAVALVAFGAVAWFLMLAALVLAGRRECLDLAEAGTIYERPTWSFRRGCELIVEGERVPLSFVQEFQSPIQEGK